MSRHWALQFALAMLLASQAQPIVAQSTLRVTGRLDLASFTCSDRRSSGARPGAAIAVETATPSAAGRLVLGYAPPSESAPGWESIAFEAVPYVVDLPRVLSLGLRLMGGAQHVTASNRARRPLICDPSVPCFREGIPGLASSWAAIIGASAEGVVPVGARWSLGASVGLGYLVGGRNGEARVVLSTFGIGYALQ